jgi:DNA-binding LacI/PurR family transcriptional regulator
MEAARSLNYTVDRYASGLRTRQSRTIALLFFEDPTPDDTLINPFYLSMVGSLTRACASKGYDLLISMQQLSGDWHVDYEDSRKADGILLLGYGDYMTARPRLEQLVRQGTHFVRWGAARAGQVGTTVGSDNEQGGWLAGKHLIERGRRSIAFLGTVSEDAPEFVERWTGYHRALSEAGLSQDELLRVDAAPSEEAGRLAAMKLLEQGVAFDGIFATSDLVAIGAMRALHDAGKRIPEDVSIVGFDDLAAARMAEPAITTVAQDTRLAAETLVETLIAKIDEHAPESVLLPVRLVVRGSS